MPSVIRGSDDFDSGQLSEKAPLLSPALTGTPTAPTPTAGDNSTKIATTAFVLANVGAAIATMSVSTVGTYMLAIDIAGTGYVMGATIAGSSLKPSNTSDGAALGTARSGTWRCMGQTASGTQYATTLWLRIA